MADAPRQDWSAYAAMSRREEAEWVRGLTAAERFAIYEDLFDMIWIARRNAGESEQLDRWRWDQKLAQRTRMVEAFTKLDQIHRGRAAATNAG